MGYTKKRLVEMMEKVAGTKVIINEVAEKGTRINVVDVSPETIEIGEKLPSIEQGDVSITMSRPNQINWWKKDFINRFGRKGYLEKGKTLNWSWDVIGNRDYEIWKNNSLSAKQNWLDMERAGGNNFGLD